MKPSAWSFSFACRSETVCCVAPSTSQTWLLHLMQRSPSEFGSPIPSRDIDTSQAGHSGSPRRFQCTPKASLRPRSFITYHRRAKHAGTNRASDSSSACSSRSFVIDGHSVSVSTATKSRTNFPARPANRDVAAIAERSSRSLDSSRPIDMGTFCHMAYGEVGQP